MKFYLLTVLQVVKFIFFPSLIRQKEKISGVPSVSIDFKKEGIPLIISFAGLGEQFNFGKTLDDLNVNVIYLRDVNHNWYLNGLSGVGDYVEDVSDFLINKIVEIKPSKVITLGTSAGGFAAILYGHMLQADAVLAFSPQTFMNRWNCIKYLDYRWLDRVVQIYQGDRSNRVYLDLKEIIFNTKTSITLVYDKTHRLDRIHSMRLKGNGIVQMGQDGGGHTVVKELRESGFLANTINQLLNTR